MSDIIAPADLPTPLDLLGNVLAPTETTSNQTTHGDTSR